MLPTTTIRTGPTTRQGMRVGKTKFPTRSINKPEKETLRDEKKTKKKKDTPVSHEQPNVSTPTRKTRANPVFFAPHTACAKPKASKRCAQQPPKNQLLTMKHGAWRWRCVFLLQPHNNQSDTDWDWVGLVSRLPLEERGVHHQRMPLCRLLCVTCFCK